MASSAFEIKINTTDDPAGVRDATLEAIKYTEALGKVAAQEERMAANKAAKDQLKNLTDEEKKAASAAYLLAQEQTKANQKLNEAGPAAAQSSLSMTELWNSVQQARQYFQILEGAVDKTVGKFVIYAGQVRDLSALSGANAEQTSRMIQMAGAAHITFDELSKSLEFAAKKGLEPNIAMLARSSEEYLKLAPGLERSTFLMENFGEKNTEMYKILELGPEIIKANAAAISQKLILDEDAIQKAKDYTTAQNNLNEAIDGMSMAVGEKTIPILTQAAQAMELLLTMGDRVTTAWKEHAQEVLTTSTSYRQYKNELQDTIERTEKLALKQTNTAAFLSIYKAKNDILTESQWAVAKSTGAATQSVEGEKTAIAGMKDKKVTVTTDFKITGDYHTDYLAAFLASHPGYAPGAYSTGGTPSGRAKGGDVSAETPYWVGEEGIPELFVPQSNGRIVPLSQVGGNLVFNYSPLVSLATLAEAENVLLPMIRKAMRST